LFNCVNAILLVNKFVPEDGPYPKTMGLHKCIGLGFMTQLSTKTP